MKKLLYAIQLYFFIISSIAFFAITDVYIESDLASVFIYIAFFGVPFGILLDLTRERDALIRFLDKSD